MADEKEYHNGNEGIKVGYREQDKSLYIIASLIAYALRFKWNVCRARDKPLGAASRLARLAPLIDDLHLHRINPPINEFHGENGNEDCRRYHGDVDEFGGFGGGACGIGFERGANVDIYKVLGQRGDSGYDEDPELHTTCREERCRDYRASVSISAIKKGLIVHVPCDGIILYREMIATGSPPSLTTLARQAYLIFFFCIFSLLAVHRYLKVLDKDYQYSSDYEL